MIPPGAARAGVPVPALLRGASSLVELSAYLGGCKFPRRACSLCVRSRTLSCSSRVCEVLGKVLGVEHSVSEELVVATSDFLSNGFVEVDDSPFLIGLDAAKEPCDVLAIGAELFGSMGESVKDCFLVSRPRSGPVSVARDAALDLRACRLKLDISELERLLRLCTDGVDT